MRVETLGNVGAICRTCVRRLVVAGSYGTGTYKIENFGAVAKVILTNTGPVDAYRVDAEAAYIAERTIEAVAHLGHDPVACGGSILCRDPIFRIALTAAAR
jgi:carbon-monoxide dehydrogenase large subunit